MTPPKRTPTGKGLTVSGNKKAILLRFPKTVVALFDKQASAAGTDRTKVIYRLLSRSTQLKSVRSQLEALCREKSKSESEAKNGTSSETPTTPTTAKTPSRTRIGKR